MQKSTNIDEICISYNIEGQGETIILLHGWPQTSYMWRKITPVLSKKFRVITLDLPGLGNSSVAKSYDTKNIATILNEFIKKLKIEKFHLVGHDIGAWVATTYCIYFKESLKSLTIIDAGIPGLIPDELFCLGNTNKIWQFFFHSVEKIPEFLVKGREKEYISWYFNKKSYIKDAINEEDIQNYYLAYKDKMKNGFEYYRYFQESAKQNKVLTSKLDIKILAIGGEFALKEQVGVAMQKISNQVTTKVMENCGHYISEEQPEKLTKILIDFYRIL
ncbi:alpha/beta fold hydrolase [Aliarcobacter lanthieri]|uniref:alpha/beta fold hydrolase n=1 Tax=Aliarcobacter lanthieri TaxID=1355374 RepID=UPI003AB00F7F